MNRAAVVIVTYNNPAFLGICLAAYKNQSHKDFAIFIADDGSTDETRAKIDEYRRILRQPVTHFWHPDRGYRKAQIVNHVWRALDPAEFPIVINVDHDTVAHRRFVEDHVCAHAKSANLLFMGRRVNLGPKVTQTYTEENVTHLNHGLPWRVIRAALQGDVENANRGVRKSGTEIRGSRSIAIQYHLYHKMLTPDPVAMANYYQVLLHDHNYKYCAQGIAGSKENVQDVIVYKG
jgi:glycosyltransferase involved in cell wall biosynthesis